MKNYSIVLFTVLAQNFNAYSMEKSLVKHESPPLFKLASTNGSNKIFSVLDMWGFIKVAKKSDSLLELPADQLYFLRNGCVLSKEQLLQEDVAKNLESYQNSLQQIFSLWNIKELMKSNELDTENLLVDLISWMQESELTKNLIKSVKKDDGTYDLKAIESELKKQFEEYCSTAFSLEVQGDSCPKRESCIVSKAIACYFPFFSTQAQYAKKSFFLGDYSRQTVLYLKKILYILYHFSLFSKPKRTYEQIAASIGSVRNLPVLTLALQDVLTCANPDQLLDLLEIAHSWDSKPIMEALLDSLKYHDFATIEHCIERIPLSHFVTIGELIESNDFIANLVALKIHLYRNRKLDQQIAAIGGGSDKFLETGDDSSDESDIEELLENFALCIYTLDTNVGFDKLIKSVSTESESNQPFYKLLDPKRQELLKNKVIKRYALTTMMSLASKNDCPDLDLLTKGRPPFCQAEKTADGVFYFYDGAGGVRSYFLKEHSAKNGFKQKIFESAGHATIKGCIARVSFGNNHDWVLAASKKEVIRLSALSGSKNKNANCIRIHRLACWGEVTALCAYGSNVVVAYESGALELIDLTKFAHFLQACGEKEAQVLTITCTKENSEKRHALSVGLPKHISIPTEDTCCKLLAMNDTYIVGASKNTYVRVWKDKKLLHYILLPQNREQSRAVTVMHLFANDRLAVGCNDGTTFIIDLKTGYRVSSIKNKHDPDENPVTALTSMGEDGQYIVVAHKDGQVHMWDYVSNNDEPCKIIGAHSCPIGVQVAASNKGVLEIIYADATVKYVFMPELAQLEEVIKVLKNTDLSNFE